MRLETISRGHILDALEKEFGFKNVGDTTRVAAISEHIRAALCLECRPDGSANTEPVATVTITRTVLQRLSPIWPDLSNHSEQTRSKIVDAIEELARLGELTKVDSYHWLPAPSRVITVDAETELLISPTPLSILPLKLRKATQIVGRCRLIDTKLRPSVSAMCVQGLTDWLGSPASDAKVWLKAFIGRSATAMSAVHGLEGAEIFDEGGWKPCRALTDVTGTQLYRRAVLGLPTREYGLCRIRRADAGGGEICAATIIPRQDARRVQAVLAAKIERSRRVRYCNEGATVTLFLPRPFPEPENGFLRLGWRSAEQSAADWPRRYTFSTRLLPLLGRAVGLLGHELVEQKNGE